MPAAKERKPKVIIVGAGVGGIATAARLAHAGCDVEVYEKNEFSGGRCSLIHHEGYRFDQGPSLLLLPRLFRQLYTDLGTTLEDHVELVQCDPNYTIHYHDGEKVVLSSNRAQLAEEVDKWEGHGGSDRLEGFLAEARVHGELSYSLVLSQHFPSLLSFLRPSVLANLLRLHPFGSLWGRCSRYFRTDRMRRAFSFGSMYLGSSPFDSPGTYSLLQWTESCEGIWYPIGGFHRVPASLVEIAEFRGAKFHFNSPVRAVTHDASKWATGVMLDNGEVKKADIVVVNADLVWAYNNLFTEEGKYRSKAVKGKEQEKGLVDPKLAKKLLDKPHSCSSISFYWAMNRQIDSLNAHNIFLAEDYRGSFDDIFKQKAMPREPSFYVNVPSKVDPSAAPKGKDTIVVLVPVGHLLPDDTVRTSTSNGVDGKSQDWPALVDKARAQVIETMEARLGIKGLKKMIAWEGVNTPETWKEKFNLTHGSILGITHDFFNVLSFRHQARHNSLKGAYFVGASAHPGTGVPIAIAGSRLCTEAILADIGMPLPRTYEERDTLPKRGPLDRQRRRSLLYIAEEVASFAMPYLVGAVIALALFTAWLIYTDRLHHIVKVKPPTQIERIRIGVQSHLDRFEAWLGIPYILPMTVIFLFLSVAIIVT